MIELKYLIKLIIQNITKNTHTHLYLLFLTSHIYKAEQFSDKYFVLCHLKFVSIIVNYYFAIFSFGNGEYVTPKFVMKI